MVRLLKSRTIVRLGGLRSLDQSVEEKRATTDPLGFFELECSADPEFPYYYLRFYDPKGFDSVKYRLPEDREITKRVRQGRPVEVSVPLKLQPDWPKVKALIDAYSPGSQMGQVLRSLGLPTSRAPEGPGRELWIYDRAGVAYLVEGPKVIETRTLPGGPKSAEVTRYISQVVTANSTMKGSRTTTALSLPARCAALHAIHHAIGGWSK